MEGLNLGISEKHLILISAFQGFLILIYFDAFLAF